VLVQLLGARAYEGAHRLVLCAWPAGSPARARGLDALAEALAREAAHAQLAGVAGTLGGHGTTPPPTQKSTNRQNSRSLCQPLSPRLAGAKDRRLGKAVLAVKDDWRCLIDICVCWSPSPT